MAPKSRKTVKTRRRKTTATAKLTSGLSARSDHSSLVDLQEKLDRQTRELNEALERHTATTEILKIISASPTDLQSVLEVVVKSAARYCEADDVAIFELDGEDLRSAAHCGAVPPLDIGVRFPCSRGTVAGRIVLERRPIQVIDLQAEAEEFPEGSVFVKRLGHRTILGAPLLRDGMAIGTIQLRRAEAHPFTDRQISLLETFAAQAVIAIENARLLDELRQRTTDLTESLEQQTATSEVLKIISSSPGMLQPVFDAVMANATRLSDAKFGGLFLAEGDKFRCVAMHNLPRQQAETLRREPLVDFASNTGSARAMAAKRVIQIDDLTKEPGYIERVYRRYGRLSTGNGSFH